MQKSRTLVFSGTSDGKRVCWYRSLYFWIVEMNYCAIILDHIDLQCK